MIQKETYLNVIDNTGALIVGCIHVYRYKAAKSGDIILVSIKKEMNYFKVQTVLLVYWPAVGAVIIAEEELSSQMLFLAFV